MKLKDIALLNLRRRKAKAFFILAGLMIGVTTVVALVTLFQSVSHDILHKMEKYGANIIVVPKSENLSLSYGGMSVGGISLETQQLSEVDVDRIRTIPTAKNLAAIGPMVLGAVNINGKNVMLAGVDFQVSRILKPWWEIGEEAPQPGQLVVGSTAAEILGANLGETLKVGNETMLVTKVLEQTGSQDDQIIFTDTKTAQKVLNKQGIISMVEVAAHCMDCPIEDIIIEISAALPGADVMAIKQVVQGRMDTMSHFEDFLYGISLVVVLVGCLVVLVTMTSSVRERTTEIGIFRAIGYRRSLIMKIIMYEAAVLSVLAGVLGYAAGLGSSYLALPFFTGAQGTALYIDYTLAGGAVVSAVLLGLVSSAYPALVASRMDPNEALRSL
jgi:putative ABC transport system permease protein